MLHSMARRLTLLLVPLFTVVHMIWVGTYLMLDDNPALDQHPMQGGAEILLVAS